MSDKTAKDTKHLLVYFCVIRRSNYTISLYPKRNIFPSLGAIQYLITKMKVDLPISFLYRHFDIVLMMFGKSSKLNF